MRVSTTASDAKKSALPRLLKRVLWTLLRIYLLLVLLVYLLQGKLLYLPSVQTLTETAARASFDQLTLWPQNAPYQALLSSNETSKGVVVVFHGNAGTAGDREFYARYFAQCGLRTLLVEYPGYGARPAAELRQNALGTEGAAIILAAKAQFKLPIYVVGESLGSAVAAQAIKRAEASAPGSVAGATLITPWDELAAPARARFWFLPVQLMLHDAYDSVQALQNVRMPLVVVRAQQDALIPARATQNLFAHYPGPKTLIELPGSHVSWLMNTDAGWWQEVCGAMTARNSLVTPES
jgi:uncharacterized protein